MFSFKFLHEIRGHEFQTCRAYFPAGARVLEIGGGDGAQAAFFAEQGFDISSIDVEGSHYDIGKFHAVRQYDGHIIPFPDGCFEFVFSSNVLEHIAHLDEFQLEIKRVLKPDGFCIHIMPTASWVFWSAITHYLDFLARPLRGPSGDGAPDQGKLYPSPARLLPPRHGAHGTVYSELFIFNGWWWTRHFKRQGFDVIASRPMGLFYTGNMLFGAAWSLRSRARWASVLGSACRLYKIKPRV